MSTLPLVKTAIHGADPNWGRIAMAVGKVNDEDIDQNNVVIESERELFRKQVSEQELEELRHTYKATRCSFMCHSEMVPEPRGPGAVTSPMAT